MLRDGQPSTFSQVAFVARKYSLVLSAAAVCAALFVFFSTIGTSTTGGLLPNRPVDNNAKKPQAADTCPPSGASNRLNGFGGFDGRWNAQRDSQNLMLSSEQCDAAFPGLYDEIDRMVENRKSNKITRKELDELDPEICDQVGGHVKGYIYDHHIYVTDFKRGYFTRPIAILQALHRAVVSSPERLPNIQFTLFTVDISCNVTAWALTRLPDDTQTWLMPDFGYWSWPEPKISSYSHVQRRAREIEEGSPGGAADQKKYTWANKTPKLVWRGAQGPDDSPRSDLYRKSKDKSWSDVMNIIWDPKKGHEGVLSMDDHCKYKYVAHTAGGSYSGRLKYLQNCRSVVVSHKLIWLTHAMHMMKASGPDQNFVQVERDYNDLDEKMQWLMDNDEAAERIAAKNVETFRDRYLSPAAETCYWRRLVKSWASVSEEAKPWEEKDGKYEWKGVPLEDFLVMHTLDWEQH